MRLMVGVLSRDMVEVLLRPGLSVSTELGDFLGRAGAWRVRGRGWHVPDWLGKQDGSACGSIASGLSRFCRRDREITIRVTGGPAGLVSDVQTVVSRDGARTLAAEGGV
jgi:hypothetical protein